MTSMKKFLLAAACAGLLALGAGPVLAAGPMTSTPRGDAVHKTEYRWNHWQGRRTWHQPPRRHYHAPPYGRAYGHTPWFGHNRWHGRNHWREHRGYAYPRYNNRGYWNQPIR